ncbi:hypothetical protein BKA80DRAFT_72265 [Phyllosticta citrichinensis]
MPSSSTWWWCCNGRSRARPGPMRRISPASSTWGSRRCAVYEIGPQCSRPCTPAQEQAYDAFVKARDRLAERVIADAGKRASRNAWDTEPFPSAPDKQVEYVRCWVNEHLQVNTNMDLFYKLINFS